MKGIICIGRQYGSGGREVGEKLARKLGIPCYDKLLIKKAALESGLSTDFIYSQFPKQKSHRSTVFSF